MWKQNLILFTIFFLFILIAHSQARNEYLQNQNPCERGTFEPYAEMNQRDYKSGISNEYQDQRLGFRFRMPLGAVCSDDYIAEQKKKDKIRTQLELIKECKRIPKISPPPAEFAELFNMCNTLGVVGIVAHKKPDGNYWLILKDEWKAENPDRPIYEDNK